MVVFSLIKEGRHLAPTLQCKKAFIKYILSKNVGFALVK
jgi:hypothetical protein